MVLSENARIRRSGFSKGWIKYAESLDVELIQAWDEGRDLPEDMQARVDAIMPSKMTKIGNMQRRNSIASSASFRIAVIILT